MTVKQLKKHLEVSDLDFAYKGKIYGITPVNVFEPFIACEKDKEAKEYKTFDALLNDFIVGDKPLNEVLKDIDW